MGGERERVWCWAWRAGVEEGRRAGRRVQLRPPTGAYRASPQVQFSDHRSLLKVTATRSDSLDLFARDCFARGRAQLNPTAAPASELSAFFSNIFQRRCGKAVILIFLILIICVENRNITAGVASRKVLPKFLFVYYYPLSVFTNVSRQRRLRSCSAIALKSRGRTTRISSFEKLFLTRGTGYLRRGGTCQ